MSEIRIKVENNKKEIVLVNEGKLEEYYEENEEENRYEGNIYIGIVKNIVKGMEAAFVDIGTEKNAFIHLKDLLPKVNELENNKVFLNEKKESNIEHITYLGQKVLVQVKKDSTDKKGARISTHINFPSKYVVLMPNTNIITASQKIENEEERKRLKDIIKQNISKNNGAVIRTLAVGKTDKLIEDIKYIENKWNNILNININVDENKPRLLYKSEDIVAKMLIDLTKNNIDKIVTNSSEEIERIKELIKYDKEYENMIFEHKSIDDIYVYSDLQKQIDKIKNRKIWLNCGGFITIDKTEALTAIDVNTGKYTGKENAENTIFKVNKEATIEITKQLRKRDIGGIIIIDYIDMNNMEDKKKIEQILKEELKKDRSKTQVEGFTKLELMEMTRKHICSHTDKF